jgi:hypothetical protein
MICLNFSNLWGTSQQIKLRNWYLQTSNAKLSKEPNATFNEKFWEEVIAYFSLIRRGPHTKHTSNNSPLPREIIYGAVA